LFAGEGKDVNGVPGSPVRLLNILNQNKAQIIKSKVKIRVIINEFDKEKYDNLILDINEIADVSLYTIELHNDDFAIIFDTYYELMKATANFLFLDQNGIKQITENIFSKLIQLKATDFLFFISSSYIKRFADVEEFKKYLKITKEDLHGKSYYHIHRVVLKYYRSMIPIKKKYFLAPFSIKKPTGIYGLIFGTNHTLGIEKFLHVCWKHDKLRGEANFDIDNERINLDNPGMFPEYNIPSKRQVFENLLKQKIINKELQTDFAVYLFSLNEGFLLKDANNVLKELSSEGRINFNFKLSTSNLHKIKNPTIIKLK
jgi:three-Cys-motif partner protein